jgi:TonB-linked SusC/RagA family outer membrane protein
MRSKFKWIFTLLIAFTMQFSFAQEKTVTGVVSDAIGPMPSANVVVKGTTRGVATDIDGKFALKAKAGDVLIVSFSGYAPQNVTVGASSNYIVRLKEAENKLDEVVITAFGIKRETKKLAYSTQKVDAAELVVTSPINAVTAMQGKVSGLNVITRNNGVNPSTAIILRGYKSLTGDNSALIVIDGIVQGNSALDNLNPNDIASVNVLKGSSATALYGSQGKNGAMIVTTKQGSTRSGLNVTYNTSYVVERIKYFPELQTTFGPGFNDQYDPFENTSWGPRFDGVPRRVGPILADGSFQLLPYQAIKNNRSDFFQDGITAINGATLSGGDENSTFYFSAQRSDIAGITPKDKYVKDNFRFNASRTMGDFKITVNTSYFSDKSDIVGSGGYQSRPLFWSVINTPANIPLTSYKNWRTDPFATPEGYFNEFYQNPYTIVDIARNVNRSNRLLANVKFEYKLADWANVSYSLASTYFNSRYKNTREAITYNPALAPSRTDSNTPASVSEGSANNTRLQSDILFTFTKKFAKDFDATLILGNTVQTLSSNNYNITGNNLFVPDLYNVSVRTGEPVVSVGGIRTRLYGNFADLTVGYKNFLTLNGAYRRDTSSTLLLTNNSFDFYTYGASLLMTELLPGIKGDVLDFWKLSGSYALVGAGPAFGFTNQLYSTPTGFPFGSTVGLGAPTRIVSADIAPSITKTIEFGTEFVFAKKRLNLGITYFINNSTKDFLSGSVSNASGASILAQNAGELQVKGLEIDLNGSILKSQNFEWRLGVNVFKQESEVIALTDGAPQQQVGLSAGDVGVFAVVGQPYPSLLGTAYERDEQGRVVIDGNGDPQLAVGNKNFGTTTPDLILGFNTSVRYKQFNLSATADYKTGHVYYNNLVDALEFTGSTTHSVSSGRQPFVFPNSSYVVTPATPTTPAVYAANTNITTSGGGFDFWTGKYQPIRENYVTDATTFKLREVALTYDIPAKVLDRTFIKGITFGLVARNILMLRSAQNKYTDPEFTNDSQQVTGFGTQDQLPPTASYGFKMDVKF